MNEALTIRQSIARLVKYARCRKVFRIIAKGQGIGAAVRASRNPYGLGWS